ncbi:unnamed protein product [Acanthoscelides obtectus]|uniref:Uncharacterized protein n=1 Tax=Acanthoscelides obtectus TaxID=200917 RepID=A0A9P0L9Z2_ACAOB|nr:unnamed protein product [Acanthoscelides obtectus]CAK1633066.1 hypothetical protein AOBTE_LOCUS7919 [Acanthoscelides obtectus]
MDLPIQWLPRSPDRAPLDFSLGTIKKQVYSITSAAREELEHKAKATFPIITHHS